MNEEIREDMEYVEDTAEKRSKSGIVKGVGLTVSILSGLAALGVAAYKKHKSKKKTKDEAIDVEAEVSDCDPSEEEVTE